MQVMQAIRGNSFCGYNEKVSGLGLSRLVMGKGFLMAAFGKWRKIITRNIPGGDALPDSGAWPIIRECLLYVFLIVLVFHVYAHSKDGPFVFDDLHNIAENPHIQISHLDWESLRGAAFESPLPTRPIANLSFALNYYFNQLDSRGFRLANVLIHLGNGLLLLLFLKATLRTPVFRDFKVRRQRYMPFAAVTIWIVNPVHTQSVSYIVQRMNSLATLFYLLAFLLYVYARLSKYQRRRWYLLAASLLAFLLALGSKENSITLPFFIFLYEWYFFRDLDYQWLKKNYFYPLAILVFWLGMASIYFNFHPEATTFPDYEFTNPSLAQRFMTQSRVIIFYIFLFLFPHPSRLNLDHHFPISLSPFDPPTTLLAMLAIIALLATAVLCARRERLLSFCILWFLGNLLIESSVPGLDMVFEHRTYLPTVLISMVIVMFLYYSVAHIWARRAVLLVFVAIGTLWTHERNEIWANNLALWDDTVKKSPAKARPSSNLGIAYGELGQLEESIHYLQQAVHLKPDYEEPRFNLALSLLARGDYRQAEQHARVVLEMSPNDTGVMIILGMSLANQERFDEALDNFSRALQVEPDDPYTHFYISQILANTGQIMEAVRYCSEALRIKPDYEDANLFLRQMRQEREEGRIWGD